MPDLAGSEAALPVAGSIKATDVGEPSANGGRTIISYSSVSP